MKKINKTIIIASLALTGCGESGGSKHFTLTFEDEGALVATREVEAGKQIGELPSVNGKIGYSYVWQIDDESISSETIYDYGSDKKAITKYSPNQYNIVFPELGTNIQVTFGMPIGELPAVPSSQGKANGRWVVENTVITSNTIYNWAKSTVATSAYDDEVYTLSFAGSDATINVKHGDVIGTLPSIPAKEGEGSEHYIGVWTIDGNAIDESSLYDFYENKEAIAIYRAFIHELYDGEEVDINSPIMRELLDAREEQATSSGGPLCEVIDNHATEKVDYKNHFRLQWNEVSPFDYCLVSVSRNADLSEAKEYLTLNNFIDLDLLDPDTTYYYQIEGFDSDLSNPITSEILSFKTKSGLRVMDVEGVDNFRDIANFPVSFSGKRIKKGMVYRSGNLDNITSKGLLQIAELGIKSELDLREEYFWREQSYLGADVNYFHVENAPGGVLYVGPFDDETKTHLRTGGSTLKDELLPFVDPTNYPIDIHCAIGRDRTGTLAMILEALVGVSIEDMAIDYMASLLSDKAKIDNPATQTAEIYYRNIFDTIGYIKDVAHEYDDLPLAVEKYLTDARNDESYVGLTSEQVESIRNNILEEI